MGNLVDSDSLKDGFNVIQPELGSAIICVLKHSEVEQKLRRAPILGLPELHRKSQVNNHENSLLLLSVDRPLRAGEVGAELALCNRLLGEIEDGRVVLDQVQRFEAGGVELMDEVLKQ